MSGLYSYAGMSLDKYIVHTFISYLCRGKTLADCGCEFQATDLFEPGKVYTISHYVHTVCV